MPCSSNKPFGPWYLWKTRKSHIFAQNVKAGQPWFIMLTDFECQPLLLGIPIKIPLIKNRKHTFFFFLPASLLHKVAFAEERGCQLCFEAQPHQCTCCGLFFPWFKWLFYFLLLHADYNYHTLPYPDTKVKKIRFKPRIKYRTMTYPCLE